ncbi:hypothetical protein ABE042_04850 [Viridibacillus arvi]|uniref:hypothetical protein n=1 Tax=Viridibacillus arvi TaxID=263475 RepID=UPI003D2A3DCC
MKILLIIMVTALVLLSIPAILSGMMTIDYFSKSLGSADGWLSYWGGYLGALVGLTGLFIATKVQLKNQSSNHNAQMVQQSRSIYEAAEENDKLERKRFKLVFVLKKHEEILQLIIEIQDLLNVYFNNLGKYIQYHEWSAKNQIELDEISRESKDNIDKEHKVYLQKKVQSQIDVKNKVADIDMEIRLEILKKFAEILSKKCYMEKESFVESKEKVEATFITMIEEREKHLELESGFLENYKTECDNYRRLLLNLKNNILPMIEEHVTSCSKSTERKAKEIVESE